MPQVAEITSSSPFSRSSEEGTVADSITRAFRIINDTPGVAPNVQQVCNVFIGDVHPENPSVYCTSFRFEYEGDSRMVVLATFDYRPTPANLPDGSGSPGDQKSQAPDIRPANFSISTSLLEKPIYTWRPLVAVGNTDNPGEPFWLTDKPGSDKPKFVEATNAAGDMYDGITQLTGMVNITITQSLRTDPTLHNEYVGYINEEEITLGTLVMAPHTVMLRGVQSQPYVESWGRTFFRGWKATYEFAYKKNQTEVSVPLYGLHPGDAPPGNEINNYTIDLGWDIAVPQSGHNVKAFTFGDTFQNDPQQKSDGFGQPLRHGDPGTEYAGVVMKEGENYLLPPGVNVGDRVPAMVRIFSYENGSKGFTQARAASPIALNFNGRPRKETADPKVLVYAYQVQPSVNFTTTFELRLE